MPDGALDGVPESVGEFRDRVTVRVRFTLRPERDARGHRRHLQPERGAVEARCKHGPCHFLSARGLPTVPPSLIDADDRTERFRVRGLLSFAPGGRPPLRPFSRAAAAFCSLTACPPSRPRATACGFFAMHGPLRYPQTILTAWVIARTKRQRALGLQARPSGRACIWSHRVRGGERRKEGRANEGDGAVLDSLSTPLASEVPPVHQPAVPPVGCKLLVRKGGFEPPRSCERQPLKTMRQAPCWPVVVGPIAQCVTGASSGFPRFS